MNEPNSTYTPTDAPAGHPADGAAMSTPETLSGIFFEPGRTFEALRARPRFLVAAALCIVCFMSFYLFYLQRIGYDNIINAELETRAQKTEMSDEQKQAGRDIQTKPFVKAIRYLSPPIGFLVVFAAGAGIYLLGVMLMGKSISYKQALAVWTYASLPPLVLLMLANIIFLLLRPPDPTDPSQYSVVARGLGGLVHANPGAFMAPDASAVLVTALGAFDLFALYGLFLAAIGLRKVARLSAGSAWTIVLVIYLLGVIARIGVAYATGNPAA